MPIRTLHLTNYWHERSGGIATFYRELMASANLHQRSMALVVPGECNEVQKVGEFCRIYKIAAPCSPLNHDYRTIYPSEFLLAGSRVQRIVACERPDLIEICDKYSLVHLGPLLRLGLARGLDFRPVVVGLSCERMDENFATYVSRSWWGRAFSRFYIRHVYFPAFDHHIAVSANTAAELESVADGHLVPRGTWIRPMGVDIEQFSSTKRSPSFRQNLLGPEGDASSAALLLYVGRLAPEKNIDLLIATMKELEKTEAGFRLVLAGDGIARSALERAAEEQVAGKVIFLGHIADRQELGRLYASCDLFVHPNPAEPFGIAPLEAMASGLPLVAPDRGGITSYANSENSYLAPPNAVAFAEAVRRAWNDKAETARKIDAARKTAEDLAWPVVTESFQHLYDALHRIRTAQQTMDSAQPAFVSSAANATRAACLRAVSKFARACFSVYRGASRNHLRSYPTELNGAHTP